MAKFIVRRLGLMLLTMFIVSIAVFTVSEILPMDVARNILGQYAGPEQIQALRKQMGLDRPVYVRYVDWITGFARGDLGTSTQSGRPVGPTLLRRAKNSAVLAGIAWIAIMPLALLLGVIAALRSGSLADRFISVTSLIGTSMPGFAIAVFLIVIFSIWLHWLPGSSALDHEDLVLETPAKLVMPILVLILADVGYVARMTRASIVEVMNTAYVRTAVLKGLPYWEVVFKHILRNGLLAPITVIMLHINWLIGGLVVTETVFGFPGLGSLMLAAANNKDVNMVEAGAMVFTMVAVSTQLLADLIYTYLNPRIRFG